MEQSRGNWYLLTGLILGLIMGIVYSWVIAPVKEVDTHPNLLRTDYKDIYRELISQAYQANNNLPRAEARLDLLGDQDPALALAAQAQRSLAESGNLSAALQKAAITAVTPPPAPTSEEENPSSGTLESSSGSSGAAGESTPTAEGQATGPTPSPTTSPPFILQDSSAICDPTLGEPLIQVIATNGEGEGVPGVALELSLGADPKEVFYTGLKPELGLGYADYLAEPGLTYQLEIPESGLLIPDIEVPACQTEEGDSYWGSWEIYITHPN
jgi:hypothetical protein